MSWREAVPTSLKQDLDLLEQVSGAGLFHELEDLQCCVNDLIAERNREGSGFAQVKKERRGKLNRSRIE